MDLTAFQAFMVELATASGDLIRPYFGASNLEVQLKTDETIVTKAKNPDYTYDPSLLRDPKSDQKLKLPPGPNNPVGVYWLGLSKEHAGIHGTSEPSQMARVQTNGCVRLTNWDVVRLSDIVDKGTAVEVQG